MERATDEELMLRARDGDIAAFEVLVSRWEAPAVRFAFRLTGDHQAAEDCAQEAFLRVFRGAAAYVPTARFSTWFYTILGNLCRDRMRQVRRRPADHGAQSLGDGDREPPDHGSSIPSPPDALLAAEERALVAEAVRGLPTHLAQAVTLREFEGLKYREIAETLNCDLNEVKVLIHRGRKLLAERLRRILRR
jgi:RNA polymerase sigma-70 factor (ECF subfamily)